jgi:hypothetical protein
MERALTAVVLAILVAPFVILFVLVALAHLAPSSSALARVTFVCPVRRRRVNATFLTAPGFDHPIDVVACSEFGDSEHLTCAKRCLEVARTRSAPSLMTPRYSLIADGVSPRDAAPASVGGGAES